MATGAGGPVTRNGAAYVDSAGPGNHIKDSRSMLRHSTTTDPTRRATDRKGCTRSRCPRLCGAGSCYGAFPVRVIRIWSLPPRRFPGSATERSSRRVGATAARRRLGGPQRPPPALVVNRRLAVGLRRKSVIGATAPRIGAQEVGATGCCLHSKNKSRRPAIKRQPPTRTKMCRSELATSSSKTAPGPAATPVRVAGGADGCG